MRPQAEAEGLTPLRTDGNSSGYKGVSFDSRQNIAKPYLAKAQLRRGGQMLHLGSFVTAEEAALAFARASAPHTASSRKRKAEPKQEDAEDDAEDDDVEVVVLDAYELQQPDPGRCWTRG